MKLFDFNCRVLILFAFLISVSSCKKDPEYKTILVEFYTDHSQFSIVEPIWETVTEQVLVSAAHHEGAILETVFEQVLKKDAHSRFQISSEFQFPITIDAELFFADNITCFNFLDEENFVSEQINAEYRTRSYKLVAFDGNGELVPAQYATIQYERLIQDSSIEENLGDRKSIQVEFRIPEDENFNDYFQRQLEELSVECRDNISYQIIE